MEMLGVMGVRILRTNLIIHDGIMYISSKAAEFVCVLDIGEKPCNLALLCQWFKLLQSLL